MLKSKDKLTIVLTPEHLSMASVRAGKVVQAERVSLNPAEWAESWKNGLRCYDQSLRQLLARFGGSNRIRHANLFYLSPGTICRAEVSEFDETTSIAKMENAILQSIGRSNPADAIALYSGKESSLVLGVADDESNLQQIFAWLNRCHILADKMVPCDAGAVQKAIIDASRYEQDTAVLYLSDRSSVICYYEGGEPKLVRLISLGYNKLADVYSSAIMQLNEHVQHGDTEERGMISGANHGQDAPQLCDEGRELLFKHGVPFGKDKPAHNLKNVMPSMAPILQRISIEIKQTFRFASSLGRQPSKLIVCGPGASIPMIDTAMAQSLDLHIEVDPESVEYKPVELFGYGTSEHTVACAFDLDLELLPRVAKDVRVRGKLNSAIKVGALAGVTMVGGQYALVRQQMTETKQEVAQQSAVIEQIDLESNRRESVCDMATSIGSAATLFDNVMGMQVDWVSVLHSIPTEDSSLVQISELQGRMNGQTPVINVTGMAIADPDGEEAPHVLARYIKHLREIQQVKRVQIGSTTRSQIDEKSWGLNFVLGIVIESQPGQFNELAKLADAGQEVKP